MRALEDKHGYEGGYVCSMATRLAAWLGVSEANAAKLMRQDEVEALGNVCTDSDEARINAARNRRRDQTRFEAVTLKIRVDNPENWGPAGELRGIEHAADLRHKRSRSSADTVEPVPNALVETGRDARDVGAALRLLKKRLKRSATPAELAEEFNMGEGAVRLAARLIDDTNEASRARGVGGADEWTSEDESEDESEAEAGGGDEGGDEGVTAASLFGE